MDGISKQYGDNMIAVKQLDLAHRRLRFSLVSSLSVAVLAVVALWPTVAGKTLLLWLAALCVALAVRYFDSRSFLRSGYGVSFELARWKRRFAVGAALEGACWGATVICFLATPHDDVAAMMMFVIAGITAFTGVAMASARRAALAFQLPALIPTAIWLFSFGELQHHFMGLFVLAYLGLMLLFSRQMGSMIQTSLSTTEQNKELSAAVRDGERRMSRYFENAPGCLFTMRRDRDGRISMPFVSNGIATLYGLRPDEVEKNIAPMLALCPPEDVGRIVQGMERSAKNMTPYHVEYRVMRPGKGEQWVEARSLPRRDGDGSIVWHGIMLDITGQKRAQSRLELLDAAVNHSSEAIYLIGDNGRFYYVNDAACRSLDYSHAELLGMGILDIDPQITREQLADMDKRFVAGEKLLPIETLHRARDGREFPVEVSTSRVEYHGEIFSLAVVRDITERKRMESALKQRETEFRALAENLPDPVFRYDRDCRRVYVNPAAERVTATPAEQLLGNMPSNSAATLTPDSAVRAMASIREVIATGTSREAYIEYAMADGKTREYTALAVPEFDAEGQVATVLAIAHEVTDLRAAERRAANFFANMPGFAYTFSLSPEGRMSFPFASRGIEEIFGLHPEEVKDDAAPLLAQVLFDDRERVRAEIFRATQTLQPFQIEARVQRPGQPERWIECRSMPERQADGDVLWHGVMLDISERKRMEAELQRTSESQKLLLDSLRDVGMWQLVVEGGKIIYHNDSHIGGLLGYAPWDFDAAPDFIEVIHPDDRARIAEMYRRRLAGEAVPHSYEIGLLAKDGSRREYQLYVSLIPDSDPPRTMTLAVDITERKRMEEQLRMKEYALDHSGDAVFLIDEEARFIYINEQACNSLGYSRAELLKMSTPDIDPDYSQEKAKGANAMAIAEGVITFETRHQRRDGSVFPVEIQLSALEYDGRTLTMAMVRNITERKRMLELLAAREREFRSLAENLPDNIARWDTQGRYLYINPVHERTLGASASDIIGTELPASHEHVKAAIAQVVATGHAVELVRQPALVNGEMQIHEVSLSPEFDADGRIVSVLGVGRNMTNIYRMQEAIAAREREFRSLAEHLPDNIVRWDSQGRYAYVNPTTERTIGARSEEVCGKRPSEAFPDGRFSTLEAAIDNILATGQAMPCVHQTVPMENGEMRFHEISLAPERDAAGQIVGVLCVGRDMTDIYRMQEAIAAREQEFRSLAESAPDNIIRYDREGRIRYLNSSLIAQFGLSSAESLLGRLSSEIWPDGRYDVIEQAALRVVESGVATTLELCEPLGPGDEHFHHLMIAPERDAGGNIIGAIAFGRDITDIKKTQLLLEELNRHLEETSHTLEEQAVELEMSQEQLKAALEYTDGIINAIPDLLFEVDREGRYLSVWTQKPELLAAQKEDLLGRTVHEVLSPEAAATVMAGIRKADEHGLSFGNVISINLPQGECWFELSFSKKPGDAVLDRRFLVLSRDVTERKRMELALQESETRYRQNYHLLQSVFESASEVSVFALDRDYRYLSFNAQHRRNTKRMRGADIAVGMSMLDAIQREEFREFCRRGFDRVLAGDSIAVESREEIVQADGSVTYEYYENHGSPIRDDAGEIVGLTVFTHNITERKQHEEKLALLSYAVDQSDPAFLLEDGRVVYANQSTCRVLGYSEEEIIGMAVQEIDPHVSPEQSDELHRALAECGFYMFESRHKTKDGRTFPVEVSLTLLNYGGKKRTLSLARDITARKAIEKTLHDNERMLQEAQRIAHVGSWDVDIVNDKLVWSDEIFRIWEIDKTKFRADFAAFMETVHPEDRELVGRVYNEAIINHSLYEVEHRLLFPDGRVKYILEQGEPQYDAEGKPVRFIGTSLDITARKLDEEKRNELQRQLQMIAEHLPGAMTHYRLRHDLSGQMLYASKGLQDLFGLTMQDLTGGLAPMIELIHPDDMPRAVAEQEHAARTLTTCISEFRVKHPEKGELWVQQITTPVPESENSMLWYSLMFDITERKRMEGALVERQAFLDSLFEAIPVPVFYKDRAGRYLGFNRAYESAFGANREQLIGKSVFDTHPRELAETYHAKDAEVLERRVALQQYEYKLRHANGTLRDVLFSKAAFTDAHGEVSGLIGAVLDITERKRMEEEVAEARTFLNTVIDGISDPIFVKDAEHRWQLMNDACCKLLGQPREALIGKSDYDVLPKEQADVFWEKDEVVFRSGEINLNEEAINGPDGGLRYIQTVKTPFKSADGKTMLVAVLRDITERKQAEEALAVREQEFHTLVDHTPNIIARYDGDCRCLFANAAFCKLVEGGAAALLGKTPAECPGGANADVFEATLKDVFVGGKDAEFELCWHDREGNGICSHVRMTAERDPSGVIVSVLAVGHDITELNASRQKIHQMAFYDALTGLPNRALFNDRLYQMLPDASWHGQQAGVMLLDLDRFKAINDTLGHPAGDALLREAAARLTDCVRAYDTVARLGGDEFAILLPEIRSGDDLGKIASKILDAFKTPFQLEGKEVFISTSIGIAVYPGDSDNADELIRQSDAAMYAAKNSGRNAFRFYSKDLTESATEKLTLEGDLRRGFERGELELYYQPKIRLADGVLLGSEALLRWRHPACGMVSPDKFIPIAEESGLIVEIGAWVLRDACRTASGWNGPGKPLHKVAINLSARQFQFGDLLQTVRDALRETDCRTDWIELEITESLLLDEDGSVLEMLENFRKMGITIAIDDFGTGYSSLGYLARFPIDTLKIDRSFTSKVTSSDHHAELVKAMITIAHSLNQQVVAEGVETEAEAAFLREHGCQIAQGYLYGKPVPKTEFGLFPFALGKMDRRLK